MVQRMSLWVRRGCQASQRKGLTSGKVWGASAEVGELPGTSGKLPENLWIVVKFHSERTSGEVAGNFRGSSGNFWGSPGTFFQKLGGAWLPPSDSPNLPPMVMLSKYSSELFCCRRCWGPWCQWKSRLTSSCCRTAVHSAAVNWCPTRKLKLAYHLPQKHKTWRPNKSFIGKESSEAFSRSLWTIRPFYSQNAGFLCTFVNSDDRSLMWACLKLFGKFARLSHCISMSATSPA